MSILAFYHGVIALKCSLASRSSLVYVRTQQRERSKFFSPKDREKHVNVGVFYLRSSPMGRFCLPHLSWSLSSTCKKWSGGGGEGWSKVRACYLIFPHVHLWNCADSNYWPVVMNWDDKQSTSYHLSSPSLSAFPHMHVTHMPRSLRADVHRLSPPSAFSNVMIIRRNWMSHQTGKIRTDNDIYCHHHHHLPVFWLQGSCGDLHTCWVRFFFR